MEETKSKTKSVKEYLKTPNHCPLCDSEYLNSSEKEINELSLVPEIHQNISCDECGFKWTDIYTLTNYVPNEL